MRNIFEVSQEEKNRILSLHENATKKQYLLSEDDATLDADKIDSELSVSEPTEDDTSYGNDILYWVVSRNFNGLQDWAYKGNKNLPSKVMSWFAEIDKTMVKHERNIYTGNPKQKNKYLAKIGKYFRKHPEPDFNSIFVKEPYDPKNEDPESKERRELMKKALELHPIP